MSLNDDLRDEAIAHQIYLLRYQAQLVRRISEFFTAIDEQIRRELSGLEDGLRADQVDAELLGVRALIREAWAQVNTELASELAALAEYEAQHQNAALVELSPVELMTFLPPPERIVAAVESNPFEGKLLSEWTTKLEDESYIRIRDAVRMGVVEGESYAQITKRVVGTKALRYSDGVLALNLRQTQALVSTAVAHTTNQARQVFFEANDDIIKGVQWVSTLDARTTPVCQSRDGKVYPLDSGPRPPAHFRCRSVTVALTKSWRELGIDIDEAPPGTRASMDGQVPDAETYQTWLQKKSAAFQDDVLGPTRGKLFREGMPLDRFVDESGKEYTLAQLRSKDASLFKKAGID
jgi:SPP1 gp7 family putative phage head morphogenesis protein